ncbi:glycoside hydrolase family 31 protein [Silvibacterium acidisoli]|uniref:glycoside hydrolase family 31 protein n=1 Tax=Acidobacteriaceae bacterium ZG23-2 TaxID=2883246 RepID=UPI00406CC0EC
MTDRLLRAVCRILPCLAALCLSLHAATAPAHPDFVLHAEKKATGEWFDLANGTLRIIPCTNGIARVTYVPGKVIPNLSNFAIPDSACITAPFSIEESSSGFLMTSGGLRVRVEKNTGAVRFLDLENRTLLAEADWPYPRRVRPATTDGFATNEAAVWFALDPDERLYGLGQHQTGLLDQRNTELTLLQDNTNIAIPFFISSNGYGVLWNSAAVTDWDNRFRQVLAIRSNAADAVDYYYLPGPAVDTIIREYRNLTGNAPLFPKWAYGFWQSKLAYSSSDELLAVAAKYRAMHIPLDNLVLDAGWETSFGSRTFSSQYPNMADTIKQLHDEHVQLMVSIWPLFQPGNPNYDAFAARHLFIKPGANELPAYLPGARLYDAFNSEARNLYWQQAKSALYDIGVDAFWLDSTEPADLYAEEHGSILAGAQTAMGFGSKVANMFPLMTTDAIYSGVRRQPEDKRTFILTRSGFTGMQRNAAAVWSGDTLTDFDTLRRQIPAGLNYSLSGMPYWTTDIGGFVGGNTDDPAYRELYVRWFEYGAFCPVFRTHGARRNSQNELWSFGTEAQTILTEYDRLRYRLMPYIYALAARTTFEGYTPMRAFLFDFPNDPRAIAVNDEFMFGPSLLVAPVTEAGAASRYVYLPKGTDWYDFWTGKRFSGGQTIQRDAPLWVLPLYVRAGTILPLGPEEDYTGENTNGTIELRVYPGADASLKLYDDDGTTYRYEQGQYTWTPIRWDDAVSTLSFSHAEGNWPGRKASRQFQIVMVGPGHGTGEAQATGMATTYQNLPLQVRLKQ